MTMHTLIPVTLLTGFLGSGKTTVLNHLVKQPELADTLVIINEFGEIGLDHLLVAQSTENVITEMSSGCLCCTIRGDLVKTLRDITWRFARHGKRRFRRVLIETTGLADPAPIIHTLMTEPTVVSRYRLDGVVVTIDGVNAEHTLDEYPEAVKQAAVADCLLLTKSDLVTSENYSRLHKRLVNINPSALRWQITLGQVDPGHVLNLGLFSTYGKVPDVVRWLNEEAYTVNTSGHGNNPSHPHHDHTHEHGQHHHDHTHDVNRHDDHIRAFCLSIDEPITEEGYLAWLDLLMTFVGSNILRVKGILNIAGYDHPMVIHGVQHIFHPPTPLPAWPGEDQRSRIVFITRDVEREAVEQIFNYIANTPYRS
ncbi:MAG: GTP-binding protein [Nitrosomonas sp.]|nr:GTP-binding protein [Nitrosomonas sp.]MCW5606481.1 GTP-binding protein [Nitrosomonas sp.]